ncbi:hypothetical protein [Pseudomonas fluorescens]|uniref:Uncharacterized protein n=1 Tax=Pseudomonas fluorescens TaxID=294 RepID=A0A0F4V6W5_PSEFL|nr:hypothetical protein [Pseudomonas fluorescens]KJZ64588.1 hypothetical protein VD17_17115 [Pseudomonas fluorescens]
MIESTHSKTSKTSIPDRQKKNDFESRVADSVKSSLNSLIKKIGSQPIDPSDYKEVSAFKGKVDIEKVNVVDVRGGVIYFEYGAEKYQILEARFLGGAGTSYTQDARVRGAPAQAERSYAKGELSDSSAKNVLATLFASPGFPSSGKPLSEVLELLFATRGTAAEQLIKDSFKTPNQELLLREEASQGKLREGAVIVRTPTDDVAVVTLLNGKTLIVSKYLTPQAFSDYTRQPNEAGYLANPNALNEQGERLYFGGSNGSEYKTVTTMPADMNAGELTIVAKNPEMQMIYFEYKGEKFKIQKDQAEKLSGLDNVDTSSNGDNKGFQLYDYLNLLHESKDTPLAGILREAESKGSGMTLLRDDKPVTEPLDPASVEAFNGYLMLTLKSGEKVVVDSLLTPNAHDYYKSVGRQLEREQLSEVQVKQAEEAGYVKADDNLYLSDTADVKDISIAQSNQGFEVVTFTYQKPGMPEQKLYVSKESNPDLFEQMASNYTKLGSDTAANKRQAAGLPALKDVSVDDLPTTEKFEDDSVMNVGDLAFKSMIDDYRKGVKDGDIGEDDIRAQYLRAIDAKSMSINGMYIIPEHANDKRIAKPMLVTGRDVDEKIFDQKKIDTKLSEMMGDEKIQQDIATYQDKALEKVQGGDAKVKETQQKLIESASSETYINYLSELSRTDKDLAMQDFRTTYVQLAAIDPEKAEAFRAEVETSGLVLEMERLISEPGGISDENMGLAAQDVTKAALSAGKAWGDGIPRRGFGVWKETMTELSKNQSPSWGAVLKEVGDTWAKNGKIEDAELRAIIEKRINPGSELPSNNKLFDALKFMKDNGVLGSTGGTFSLVSAAYQLSGGGGSLGATHQERLSVAAAFMGILSGSNHFLTLGVKTYDALNGTGLMKELGTDRSFQSVWKPKDFKEAFAVSVINGDVNSSIDTLFDSKNPLGGNSLTMGDISKVSEAYSNKLQDMAKNSGVIDSRLKKVAGTVPRILGGIGDVGGGILGVTLGSMNLRAGIKSGDPYAIAGGSLEIGGGVGGLIGGAATFAEIFGKSGRVVAWAGPIGFGFAAVSSFVGAILSVDQDRRLHKASLNNYKDLEKMQADGLLAENGTGNYVWLQTYLHGYNQRDAPDDQSVFDYRKEDFENPEWPFKEHDYKVHIDYTGDGYNRRSDALKGLGNGTRIKVIDDEGNIKELKTGYKKGWSPV